jgi:excisionase family DNA binding protein
VLLKTDEAASQIGVHVKTLYRWKSEGKIPFVCLNGAVRFEQTSLDEFIKKSSFRPINSSGIFPPLISKSIGNGTRTRKGGHGNPAGNPKDTRTAEALEMLVENSPRSSLVRKKAATIVWH